MSKLLAIISFLLFFGFTGSFAQDDDKYDKLRDLYVARKYEKCLRKAESYTDNDKTKKDPLPYFYVSKCYYQLSQSEDPDILEYYRKPLYSALKYAIKYKKKDEEGIYQELAAEYYPKLIETYIEKTQEYYKEGKYKKVASNYKQLLKMTDDNNVRFAKGVCDAFNNNLGEAYDEIGTSITNLKNKAVSNTPVDTDFLLINYGIDYTDYLLRSEMSDSALSTINVLLKIKPGHHTLTAQKEKIKKTTPDEAEE